jgi:hypothetical protein
MNWFEIEERIWDLIDDPALGRVSYVPFANANHDDVVVAVEGAAAASTVPPRCALGRNAPNPFHPGTVIHFDLPAVQAVRLRVYDPAGRLIATLVEESLPAGRHESKWLGRDASDRQVSSGADLYRREAGAFSESRPMMLVRQSRKPSERAQMRWLNNQSIMILLAPFRPRAFGSAQLGDTSPAGREKP